MTISVRFIERKFADTQSIEKVFRTLAPELEKKGIDVKFEKLPYGNGVVGIFLNLLLFKPKRADIYHITGHVHSVALTLPADRTVLTVHDLGFLNTRQGLRRKVLKKLFLDWPVRRLKYITAISENTRRQIIEFTGCPQAKIRLIENPVPQAVPAHRESDFSCPVFLQVGTAPHKNLKNVIEALRGTKGKLRIVGPLDVKDIDALDSAGVEFSNDASLNSEEMRAAYLNADVLLFCSTFEGFGLPIVEAQAARLPVVTSNIAPMSDVAGNGAALVDPFDVESIREGITRVVEDKDFRAAIVDRGIENVRRFDPQLIAAQYIELYHKVIAHKS